MSTSPDAVPAPMNLVETVSHLRSLLPEKISAARLGTDKLVLTLTLDVALLATLESRLQLGGESTAEVAVTPTVSEGGLDAHVLIVEDSLPARTLLRQTLNQLAGCRVTEAASGREALALLAKEDLPDLCISDLCMPDMDGLALLRQIRATPRLSHLTVALCTATTDRDTVLRAAELNVSRYLVKPYEPSRVCEQVGETLRHTITRQLQQLEDLEKRLGLNTAEAIEALRTLGLQIASDVSTIRAALAVGKLHEGATILHGLKGACASLKEGLLVTQITKLHQKLVQGDLGVTLDGLESLLEEGRRVSHTADRLARVHARKQLQKDAK